MMVLSIALKLLRFKKKKEKRKTFIDFDSLSALFSKVIEREFHVGTGFDFVIRTAVSDSVLHKFLRVCLEKLN